MCCQRIKHIEWGCWRNHTSNFCQWRFVTWPLQWLHTPSRNQTFLDETFLDQLCHQYTKEGEFPWHELKWLTNSINKHILWCWRIQFSSTYQIEEVFRVSSASKWRRMLPAGPQPSSDARHIQPEQMSLQLQILCKSRFFCTLPGWGPYSAWHAGSMAWPSHQPT